VRTVRLVKGLGCLVLAMLVSCGSQAPAPAAAAKPVAPAKVVLPDTPAGRTLREWLDAFNSGDAPRMKEVATRLKDPAARRIVNVREETGGFDLVSIEKSEPRSITFVVREKGSGTQQIGWLRVSDTEPAVIDSFLIVAIPPGQTAADIHTEVDAATPARIVEAIAKTLNAEYVYPELAKKMEQSIRDHLARGDDKAITSGPELAFALTHQLQEAGQDRHVRVEWFAQNSSGKSGASEEDKRLREQLPRINCTFVKAERLDGNIGYIRFDAFTPIDICGEKVTAVFASLGDVDALIFDLRENGGGEVEMITYMESYLFAKRTHLDDIYTREDDRTTPFWTNPDVPGKKFATQPVYILTAARTFSAAEAFAYELQSVKRATIVGEVTGGGAHPSRSFPLDDHFALRVAYARAVNPVTKTDWEGTGVQPDVKVPAAEALDKAKQLAAEQLAKRH